jgi:hypothetical protein
VPDATTLNVTLEPVQAVWLTGWVLIEVAVPIEMVAEAVAEQLAALVTVTV